MLDWFNHVKETLPFQYSARTFVEIQAESKTTFPLLSIEYFVFSLSYLIEFYTRYSDKMAVECKFVHQEIIIIIIIITMELGHLLTRPGLRYPEVSSKVYHDFFCQMGSSVSLPWVIYFETFYSHVVSSFSCIPVICPKFVLFLTPLQLVNFVL